jgi:hypothetical protein
VATADPTPLGPDGDLYVAEGGLGGTNSTVGQCTQASGAAAPYTGSTDDPVRGGRISKVDASGNVTTVVDALPSSQTAPALGNLVRRHERRLHRRSPLRPARRRGMLAGVPTVPNGVFKAHRNGSWSLIADLSAFIQANPVANPDEEDFEPDGTWYSMISIDGALYPMDSNHGELDRVTPDGSISRVIDISAVVGHVVPTALAFRRHLFIANLGLFDPSDASGDEHVYELNRHGALKDVATGVEKVLGLAFRGHHLYALETSTTAGLPTPGTGAIVRVRRHGPPETIVSGLTLPTGMTGGPDGALYVSEQGFGFPAGEGRVLRVEL